MFIAGAQGDQICLNFSPSPYSYLLAGNAYLKHSQESENLGASAFMLSKCSGLFYAHVGEDYDFAVIRQGKVINERGDAIKKCLSLEHGDVIFIACKKSFNVVTMEEIIALTDHISGPTSVAQERLRQTTHHFFEVTCDRLMKICANGVGFFSLVIIVVGANTLLLRCRTNEQKLAPLDQFAIRE